MQSDVSFSLNRGDDMLGRDAGLLCGLVVYEEKSVMSKECGKSQEMSNHWLIVRTTKVDAWFCRSDPFGVNRAR